MFFSPPDFLKHSSLLLLLCTAFPLLAKQPIQQPVTDLAFGSSLYHFFLDKKLRAITELNIAKEKQTLKNQPDDADLLLAGLYFDYGLISEAEITLTRLLDENTDDNIKNRVWFNLARVQYENNNFQQAEEFLSRITDKFPDHRKAQKNYFLSSIQLHNQQFKQAAKTTSQIENRSIWSAYSQYNLGISLSNSQQNLQAQQWLTKLISLQSQDEELSSLQDSARLLSGLMALKQEQPEKALILLGDIHTSSPLSNKALLAIGWAWNQLSNPQKSLNFWLTLTDKLQNDGASLEAHLATAYAYEQLNNKILAIQHYELALQHFDRVLLDMNKSIDSINQMELINTLHQDGIIQLGFQNVFNDSLPEHFATPYLHKMFSGKKFQKAVLNYQELLEIHNSLMLWRNNLPALELMLLERIKTFKVKRKQVNQTSDFQQLQELQKQRDILAQQVRHIKQTEDSMALATENESDYLEQLEMIDSLFSKLENQQDLTEEKQKYRLLSGLLQWDISTDFPRRYWRVLHQLQLLDRALEHAEKSVISLQQTSTVNEKKLNNFRQRISGQTQHILEMEISASRLIAQQEQLINSLATDVIQKRQQHLKQLTLSARFSLTRLYDEAYKPGKMP